MWGGGFDISYTPKIDIFDTDTKSFDKGMVNNLLKQISGDAMSSVDNMTKVNELATSKTTSADMRKFNVGKPVGEDITIILGDFEWTATYLSKDKNDNTILTLWMSDSSQLSGKKYDTSKTFGPTGTSTWNSGFFPENDPSVPYPSAMYGTSYMSAVVLNNGGGYITSQGATELTTATQDSESAFALFTMAENGLTQYIVTPEQVEWQEYGQSAIPICSYNLPNENWSSDLSKVPDDGFWQSSPSYNYANKGEPNSAWKNDYLWLPSLSETGFNDSGIGIWVTSTNQRDNTVFSWLRSGYIDYVCRVVYLDASGSPYYADNADLACAIRPAFHLNLTAAAQNAISTEQRGDTSENNDMPFKTENSFALLSCNDFFDKAQELFGEVFMPATASTEIGINSKTNALSPLWSG